MEWLWKDCSCTGGVRRIIYEIITAILIEWFLVYC